MKRSEIQHLLHLLIGLKVRTIEDHPYLNITRRRVGIIKDITEDGQVTVLFKNKRSTGIIFGVEELERASNETR